MIRENIFSGGGTSLTADRLKIMPHYAVERYVEAAGIPYTILRPSYFMQNLCGKNSTYGVDMATRNEIFIPVGKGRLNFIDTRDIATVVTNICENPEPHKNRGYTLGGTETLNLFAVAEIFSQVLGRPIRYTHPSLPRFWSRMRKRGVPTGLIIFMCIEYTVTRLSGMKIDSKDLLTLLGRPPIQLAQFVQDNKERWSTQSWV